VIAQDKRTEIEARLTEMEAQEGVRVLYACESGSRAWGFPSTDSDYDVRFIYAHPIEWYLSVQTQRDVIERPMDNLIDFSGWDIGKALVLLRKSNPPLLEWLQSPIVYMENKEFVSVITALLPAYYSPRNCLHHYLHMAQGNIREYLSGDRVWVKKYFYVLRPLLACLWIEAGHGVVPMEFRKLVDGVTLNDELRQAIERILCDKLAGREMDDGPRVPIFHEFFDREIPRLDGVVESIPVGPQPNNELLDRTFRRLIGWAG
jgi:hypothetical protein